MEKTTSPAEELLAEARAKQNNEQEEMEEVELATETEEYVEPSRVPDIQTIYVKNYGNLKLDVTSINDIGLYAKSTKQEEDLFIPWTSIIMCSKKKEDEE